ncbi:hypothetical protein LCGC14_1245460, partial [marine sediment metagenome]
DHDQIITIGGATAPTTTFSDMLWADTSVTPNVIKIRNADDSAFKALFSSDGQILTESGSTATPSHSFSGDTNTGASNPSSDTYVISTGGVENARFGTSEVVFNDASNDIDFRVESDANTHMLFVDAGNNRVGIGSVTATDGTLHIQTGSAGSVTAPAFADLAVFEDSTHSGIAILVPDASNAMLSLGSASNNNGARLVWNYDADTLELGTVKSTGKLVLVTGVGGTGLAIDASQRVGIGITSPTTSAKLEIDSTTGALLFPRMTTTQRNALTAVNGMQIYNSTDNQMQGYINGSWTAM